MKNKKKTTIKEKVTEIVNEVMDIKMSRKKFIAIFGASLLLIPILTKRVIADVFYRNTSGDVINFNDLDCPLYIYIKAETQAEGNLNLSDSTNWDTSKSIIHTIKIVTDSTDWDLSLYPDDGFDELGTLPSIQLMEAGNGDAVIYLDIPYHDTDNSKEVHLKYTDNSGANTADIYLRGVKAR